MILESGNLQTMIFIQIVTHLLGRIERLLGFPREFRLDASGNDYQGLLSHEESNKIVKGVFEKEARSNHKNGRGGIKALRKKLRKSEQLLKESIAP